MNLKQLFKPLLFLTAAFVIASCSTDDCDLTTWKNYKACLP